jgi:hypothetical protein
MAGSSPALDLGWAECPGGSGQESVGARGLRPTSTEGVAHGFLVGFKARATQNRGGPGGLGAKRPGK